MEHPHVILRVMTQIMPNQAAFQREFGPDSPLFCFYSGEEDEDDLGFLSINAGTFKQRVRLMRLSWGHLPPKPYRLKIYKKEFNYFQFNMLMWALARNFDCPIGSAKEEPDDFPIHPEVISDFLEQHGVELVIEETT